MARFISIKKLSKRRFVCLVLALIMSLSSVVNTSQVMAIPDEEFYSGNDILYYDPDWVCDTGGGGASGGGVSLPGKDNIEKALSFYMGKGLSLAQAAGILGNFIQESGVDPRKEQGGAIKDDSYVPRNSVGFGIAQWTFTARQAPLVDFVKSQNVGITDLGGQLGFSWKELETTHRKSLDSLKGATTPMDAAFVFHRDFEGSADSIEAIRANRGGNAEKLFNQYKSAPPLAGGGGTPAAGSAPPSDVCEGKPGQAGQTSGFAKTVLAYAWPDYRGNTTVAKPEWVTAWQKAKSEGFYVGGISHPGIDCGGFTTRLLIDSGFEPNFNYGGKGGATSVQEKWLKENWASLGSGSSIDAATLKAGDVAIRSGHTFIYVGDIPGFGSKIASASLDERAPMADTKQSPTDGSFTWYRKK